MLDVNRELPDAIKPLGKYKGRLVSEIMEFDPAYIVWLNFQPWPKRIERLNVAISARFIQYSQRLTTIESDDKSLVNIRSRNPSIIPTLKVDLFA